MQKRVKKFAYVKKKQYFCRLFVLRARRYALRTCVKQQKNKLLTYTKNNYAKQRTC